MHHIIPPPGCKQAPSVLNGALSSPGGSFIAPLRLYTHEAKLVHCIFLFRKSSFLYPRYSMRVRKGVDPPGYVMHSRASDGIVPQNYHFCII